MQRPFKDVRPIGPVTQLYSQPSRSIPEIFVEIELPDELDVEQGRKHDLETVPSVARAEINPQGDVEAVFRHKKGSAADTRGKGIDMGAINALTFKIEEDYEVELGQYDIEIFSLPQMEVKQ